MNIERHPMPLFWLDFMLDFPWHFRVYSKHYRYCVRIGGFGSMCETLPEDAVGRNHQVQCLELNEEAITTGRWIISAMMRPVRDIYPSSTGVPSFD